MNSRGGGERSGPAVVCAEALEPDRMRPEELKRARILVVDDEEANQWFTRDMRAPYMV